MIIPDVNLLVYAYNTEAKDHLKSKAWWKKWMEGEVVVGIPPIVLFGFVRIITNGRAHPNPMPVTEAIAIVESWLEQPVVRILEAPHVDRVFKLLEEVSAGGNLVSDAQLAAVAIEENAVLHTADTDFRRFSGLEIFDPLED